MCLIHYPDPSHRRSGTGCALGRRSKKKRQVCAAQSHSHLSRGRRIFPLGFMAYSPLLFAHFLLSFPLLSFMFCSFLLLFAVYALCHRLFCPGTVTLLEPKGQRVPTGIRQGFRQGSSLGLLERILGANKLRKSPIF